MVSLRIVEPDHSLDSHFLGRRILQNQSFDCLTCFMDSFANLMLSADFKSNLEIPFFIV